MVKIQWRKTAYYSIIDDIIKSLENVIKDSSPLVVIFLFLGIILTITIFITINGITEIIKVLLNNIFSIIVLLIIKNLNEKSFNNVTMRYKNIIRNLREYVNFTKQENVTNDTPTLQSDTQKHIFKVIRNSKKQNGDQK
ncbi:MAG: hypothetical protein NC428_11630 [Clostridium sp.]|nr:hypothetical protein [Clostridium sp.]